MTHLLTLKKLEVVLKKYNLKEMASVTSIPYNTLKNYSSGKTALDSIPYRYLELISDYDSLKNYEYFSVSNLIVSSEVFDQLVKEYRKDYNPYYEYLHCFETLDKRLSNYNRTGMHDKVYYFIDSNIFANSEYKSPAGFALTDRLPTALSIGLGMGIRIILRDNRDINRDEVVVCSSLDLTEYSYESVTNRLKLTPQYELPKLDKVINDKLLKDLVTHLEYIKSLGALNDRVDEALNNINNVTPDIFE